jgi:hypothetical protein
MVDETSPTIEEFARQLGTTVQKVLAELPEAVIPVAHISAQLFAKYAQAELCDVIAACAPGGELESAVTATRRIDMVHPDALTFFASRPFARDASGDPICPTISGAGFLVPACVGDDQIDLDHPVTQVWLARLTGTTSVASEPHTSLRKTSSQGDLARQRS